MKIFVFLMLFLPLANARVPEDFHKPHQETKPSGLSLISTESHIFDDVTSPKPPQNSEPDPLKDLHEIQRAGDKSKWKIIIVGSTHGVPSIRSSSFHQFLIDRTSRDEKDFMFVYRAVKLALALGETGDALLLESFHHLYNSPYMHQEEIKSAIPVHATKALRYLSSKPGILVGGWDHTDLLDAEYILTDRYEEASEYLTMEMKVKRHIRTLFFGEYRDNFLINSAINALLNGSQRVFINAGLAHARNRTLLDYLKKSRIPHGVLSTKADFEIQTTEEQAREYLTRNLTEWDSSFNNQISQIISDVREESRVYVEETLGLSEEYELSMQPAPKHLQSVPLCRDLF